MRNKIVLLIKGFIVGGTMLVPGVSGGSMAMILGIYGELITSVNNILKKPKKSILFLGIFSIGALIGMFLFSRSILELMVRYNMPVLYFFIGAVIGGIPMIIKSCGLKRLNFSSAFYVIVGAVAVMSLTFIPGGLFSPDKVMSFEGILLLFMAGFFAAIALILPGISVSFVLLVLGIYEEIIMAIDELNILYLSIIAIGGITGIISTTKVLSNAMEKHTRPTYLIILGFVLGSVLPIFPGAPTGVNMIICPLTLVLGIAFVQLMYLLDR